MPNNNNLVRYACDGNLNDLINLFEEQNYQLDQATKKLIIKLVLNSIQSNCQNQIITYLIKKGAEYKEFLLDENADPTLISRLVACGANINIDERGYTALHAAVVSLNRCENVKILMQLGANPNFLEQIYGYGTPLHFAIANEYFDIAINLITLAGKKIDYSLQDKEGKTALIIATKVMSLEVVKKILSENKSCVNIADTQGRTALHLACVLGQHAIALELINAGADINARDKESNTPIHYASTNSTDTKNILKSIYIDPDRDKAAKKNAIFDTDGRPFSFSNIFLASKGFKITHFTADDTDKNIHGEILACIENKSELLKLLPIEEFSEDRKKCIQAQIDGITGETISQKCEKGKLPVVKLLIQSGADVTLQNKKGKTASAITRNTNIGKCLLLAETKIIAARPDPVDADGNPTTNIDYYDPELAKSVLCSK